MLFQMYTFFYKQLRSQALEVMLLKKVIKICTDMLLSLLLKQFRSFMHVESRLRSLHFIFPYVIIFWAWLSNRTNKILFNHLFTFVLMLNNVFPNPPILCVAYLSEVLEVVFLSFQKKVLLLLINVLLIKKRVSCFLDIFS